MSTPELVAYQEARVALIHEDRCLRRDTQMKHSDAEVKADQIIREIRSMEASTIWMQDHDSIPHPFPGMEFLTGPFFLVFHITFEG